MSQLAIHGSAPTVRREFPAWPSHDAGEAVALTKVVESGVWGIGGEETVRFERSFAEYLGTRHALTVTNGTVSLEIALRACGLGYGDEVIIPPYTFYATASSVMSVGAVPVFVDIDPATYNIDPSQIEFAVTERTKAIIPVHIAGRPCDMDTICRIAERHGLIVLEDAAHAHGSEWKGRRAGSIGDAGSFSFQSSKPLTCGEGGCIVTSDDEVRLRCWSVLNGGRLPEREWYEHFTISTNGRLSQFQAAILNCQLQRLDEQIEHRSRNVARLRQVLSQYDFVELLEPDPRITRDSHHFFIIRFHSERCRNLTRDRFIEALLAEGVPALSGYKCLYKQPVFGGPEMVSRTGCTQAYDQLYLEHTETATEREAVWLPQKVLLGSEEQIESVGQAVGKVYAHAGELL